MYSSQIFFRLCLIVATLILGVGFFMKFYGIESSGFSFSKTGSVVNGTLTGSGTLFIGFVVCCFCLIGWLTYKNRKKQTEEQRAIEKNEERLGKKYNVFKIRKMNKQYRNR